MSVTKQYRIVILGAGESGLGAAVLAQKQGYDVFVSDFGSISDKHERTLNHYNIDYEQGAHSQDLVLNAQEVIKSPGIPEKTPIIKQIREKGISVISEIEFAARYTNATIIGITGSNGKTTTTALTHHILSNGGLNVGLAGNIGDSFALQVAENDFDYYVLELSSFQLDDIKEFRPHISVILNITEDHLDRYEYQFENYVNSKFRITKNQGLEDFLIYCSDDTTVGKHLQRTTVTASKLPFSIKKKLPLGATLQNDFIHINLSHKQFNMSIYELGLQGKHNIYNSMAAGMVANLLDIKKETIRESMMDFKNLEHRMEFVQNVEGVDYINDSKATNVNSTWYALESMKKKVVWIAGGTDKGNDYSQIEELVHNKVKALICIGVDNRPLHDAFSKHVDMVMNTQSMAQAVEMAKHLAESGDAVLLSPCCASFDLFENYQDRGWQFKQAVKGL